MGLEATPSLASWCFLCPGRDKPARGSGWGLCCLGWGGLVFRRVVPEPSSKSVPALAGSSVLPTLTSHLPGDVGPLDCLLGGRGWPSGEGHPAGLENSPSPSPWTPHLGLREPEICACGQDDRTLPMNSTLAPRHGPRTLRGGGTVAVTGQDRSRICRLEDSPLCGLVLLPHRCQSKRTFPPLWETGNKQHRAYPQTKTEPRAVCFQSQNPNSTPQAVCGVVNSMGSGPGEPELYHWGP